jgi:hypothetical protein
VIAPGLACSVSSLVLRILLTLKRGEVARQLAYVRRGLLLFTEANGNSQRSFLTSHLEKKTDMTISKASEEMLRKSGLCFGVRTRPGVRRMSALRRFC